MPPGAHINAARLCGKCAALLGTNPCFYSVTCDGCSDLWHPQAITTWQPAIGSVVTRVVHRSNSKVAQNPNILPYYSPPQSSNDPTSGLPPQYNPKSWTAASLAQQPNEQKQARAPQRHHLHSPPSVPRVAPPKPVPIPLVDANTPAEPPVPIKYQTLGLLLIDLNHLLCNEHLPFDFCGTYSIVADPAVDDAARVMSVAWEVIRKTMLAFNVHTLEVQTAVHGAAFAAAQSCAIWMGAPPDPRLADVAAPRPCERCEHQLMIGAEPDYSALARGLQGQRIVVGVRHLLP
ncbi:hypothetical protein DFH09DRAFT_1155738 [Mycena vulgaris]|nr:hypothetical protein DFH09DRAFT_1155738 [Mycena vulgaris]